jgi:Fe-S cluster biogenesis protein NfuA
MSSATPPPVMSDDAMYEIVAEIFRGDINPMVARHGGRVDLVDVQDGTVVVRMMGGCQGCGMATVTLRQGIEAALRQALPTIQGIKDITDHAAGANPYYSAGTQGKSPVG